MTDGASDPATVPILAPLTLQSTDTIEVAPPVKVAVADRVTPAGEETVGRLAPLAGALMTTETACATGASSKAATQAAAAGMRRRSVFMAGVARGLLGPRAGAWLGAGRGDDRRILEE